MAASTRSNDGSVPDSLVPRLYIKLRSYLPNYLALRWPLQQWVSECLCFGPEPFIVWTRTAVTEGINHESADRAIAHGDRGRASQAH